jgi:uncharacterized protein (TIGR03437 family)
MNRRRLIQPVVLASLAIFHAGLAQAQSQLAIATTSLPPASMGLPYMATVQATGGTGSYTWSVMTGALPVGLSLNSSTGNITGVPPTGLFSPGVALVFQVQDSSAATASANLPISVAPPVTIATGALPSGTVGSTYTFCVLAQGGDPGNGWLWTVAAGSLPPGTSLASGIGCPPLPGAQPTAVAGVPSQAGIFPFTLQATDPDGRIAQQSFTITISPAETSAPALTLTLTPASLSFTAAAAGNAPASQTALVALSSGGSLGFSAAVTQGANWLSASPDASTTPATLTVSVSPATLSPGSYSGTIEIVAPGAQNNLLYLGVTLTVPTPTPMIAEVVNSASSLASGFAPGSLVSIKGSGLGPAAGVSAPASGGSYATELAGAQALFNGLPAPLLYASSSQINTVVPFSAAGQSSLNAQVVYNGITSGAIPISVQQTAPALFTAGSTGTGPGAILNQDGSPNSSANPAAPGSVVLLYGSGGGLFQPALADGVVAGSSLSNLVLAVTAKVDGADATVMYAGSAPGLVAGVMQINVQIPPGTRSGNVPVAVAVGGVASQAGVTLAVY